MDSLLWQVSSRTAETLLILSLFHLLLAGLTLLVLLHQRRSRDLPDGCRPEPLLCTGFGLLAFHFALLTFYFGESFFSRRDLQLQDPERLLHGILVGAVLLIAAAYHERATGERPRWLWWSLSMLATVVTIDVIMDVRLPVGDQHSIFMLLSDAMGAAALVSAMVHVGRAKWEARRVRLMALGALGLVLAGHGLPQLLPLHGGIVAWNADEHLLSLALFGFAWAAGERSRKLLDRVFVRLNLTFVVLASLIMLSTAAMEKYQYFKLTEERSTDLAEFLRGHVVYYGGQGEDLQQIFAHPEVIKRVVVEFGILPELRNVEVAYRGERAQFSWHPTGDISQTIGPAAAPRAGAAGRNQFRIIRLGIGGGGEVEFTGSTDLVNERIGNYIIFIYACFTLVLLMATAVIGMIVSDTDRQLKRQYAELQEAQQQLAQSAKLASIGELAGGMAHEINNPITGILSLASHMSRGMSAERFTARERKNLQVIATQAERIANLVKALLSFSRQTRLHLSRVDVRELTDTALDLVQFRLREADIRIVREIEPGLRPITGDASRLTEVLVNLLSNSIDALEGAGTLTVRAARDPENANSVRIEVEDSGPGIPAEELSRIFDPFYTTKAPGKGTGLGLSISHGIVKDHGGQIWAHSTPGEGTTLSISLPQEASCYEAARIGN